MTSKNIGSRTRHKGEHILLYLVACPTKCFFVFFPRKAGFEFINYVMTSKNIGSGGGHKGEHIPLHFGGCLTECCFSVFCFGQCRF